MKNSGAKRIRKVAEVGNIYIYTYIHTYTHRAFHNVRYSTSCHTRVNMGASTFFTAAMIRALRSARSRGNGGTNTLHEMHVAQ